MTGGTDMERYLGESIPKLGFGLMRLPMAEGKIDLEQVKEMVDLFLDAGFRYFDTAYGYNDGDSERAAKAALVDRYPRERFFLATKLPAWTAKSEEDAKQMFYTSLERTGAGYFDFYLLHNIGKGRLESFDNFGIWDFLAARKAEGLIRHLGFSAHCTPEMLDEVPNAHPDMEFVQLQINYADWDSEGVQARKCYEVARAHGKPVVIMEPVKGGILADPIPEVKKILEAAGGERSYASWALRFAAGLDGILAVLSGMSSTAQMEDNLRTMTPFSPLDEAEREAVRKAQEALNEDKTIACTGCHYCTDGCPMGIPIPDIFTVANRRKGSPHFRTVREYDNVTQGKGRASDCVQCGQCESACPQHLPIIRLLKECDELFR